MTTQPTVAIIIVTWNSAKIVAAALESIQKQDYPSDQVQIVVVDNSSSDGTPDLIRRQFPSVKLISEQKNHGFARGNNIAMRQVPAEYYALVNPDIVLHPGWLSAAVNAFSDRPNLGVVASKIFYGDRQLLQHTGGMVTANALTYHLGNLELDTGQYEESRDVDYAMGAAFVTRSDLARALNFLPEDYFMYFEETDYCLQVRRAGYNVTYFPQAVAYHDEKHSQAGSSSDRYLWLYHRSRYLYALRNFTTQKDRTQFRQAEREWFRSVIRILPDKHYRYYARLLLRTKLTLWQHIIRDPWLLFV